MQNSHYQKLASITFVDLVGSGVSSFLKGQLTISTDSIDSDTAKLAAFCNHKGRIISLFHIVAIDDGFRLIMPKSIVDASLVHVKKYAVFFKLDIINPEESMRLTCIDTEELLAEAVSIDHTHLKVKFSDSECASSTSTGDTIWNWQLIKNGIPWLTAETIEKFLPHYLNLPKLDAVDFNKGCFTGQEVIARMQYKAKLKQHLRMLTTSSTDVIPPLSYLEQSGKKVAEIVCSALHSDEGQRVLASVKNSANSDKEFQLKLENGSILELKTAP